MQTEIIQQEITDEDFNSFINDNTPKKHITRIGGEVENGIKCLCGYVASFFVPADMAGQLELCKVCYDIAIQLSGQK
jgi:hypothetical protein